MMIHGEMANGATNGAIQEVEETSPASVSPAVPARRNGFPTRLWPLAAVAWLPLLAIPFGALLRSQPTAGRLIATTALTLGYVALYLWLVLRQPFPDAASVAPTIRRRLLLLAMLAAIGLVLYPLFGATMPPWHLFYATIAAGIALPARPAAWMIAAITGTNVIATIVTTGWGDVLSPLVGLPAVGGGAIVVGYLVATLGELRAAREDVARLAVAEERLRFARDLHDLLGHTLSLIALKSELARELTAVAPARAAAEIGDVERAAREALREVRAVVADYRRPTLVGELVAARELLTAAGIASRIVENVGRSRWTSIATWPGRCARG